MGSRLGRAALAAIMTVALFGVTLGVAEAQEQRGVIEGTVVNAQTGQPMPGVQVSIVDSQRGTLTGADGSFRIENVQPGEREVRVQRIGYSGQTQTATVPDGQTVSVSFELRQSVVDLQEIVVTGVAGETPRAKLPFSVGRVDASEMPVPSTTAGGMLQGKIPGVSVVAGSGLPGSAPSIMLRGPTSINNSGRGRSQEPLYIVDGVILGASLVDIDAMDIEDIEVIKGAAAASLYGSRAANGVVQITTRSGRGMDEGATRFSLRTEAGMNELGRPYPLSTNHPWLMNDARTQFVDSDGNEFDWLEGNTPVLAGGDAWSTFQDGVWPQTFDHVARFFDPGNYFQNQVSLEGRSGQTNYYVSFNNLNEDGVMFNQRGFNRNNFRVNLDQGVGDDLQISASAFFSRSDQGAYLETAGGDQNPLFGLTRMPAGVDLTARGEDGEFIIRPDPHNENDNPLEVLSKRDFTDERERFLGGVDLRYSLTNWLSLDGNVSYDRSNINRSILYPRGFQTARSTDSRELGNVQRGRTLTEALNSSATATIRQRFGDLVTRTQLRYLYEEEDFDWFRAQAFDLVAGTPSLSAARETEYHRTTTETLRSEGFFLISNFDFRDRYILDGLVRRDGSSLFGADERWQTYYRGAAAWRIGEEPWFNVPAVNEFRLRYSLGSAGGRPNFAAQYETYSVVDGNIAPSTLGNSELAPEFVIEQEVGAEVVAFDRFGLDVTYASSEAQDQILQVPLPAVTGFSSQWQNAGTLTSNTLEVGLDAAIIQRPEFTWTARVNLDRTRQRITELNVPAYQAGIPAAQGLTSVFFIREGESLGTLYGNRWAASCDDLPSGMNCGEFDVNDDGYLVWVGEGGSWRDGNWGESGQVDGDSFMWGSPFHAQEDGETFLPIGSTQPDFSFSLSNTVNWRGFTVYGLLDAVQGVDVYNMPRHWATFQNYSWDMDQAGKPEDARKPVQYYGVLYNGLAPPNNHFIEDGSYVKLREMSLRYEFDQSQLANVPLLGQFQGLGINLVGRNLLTWSDYSGFDPEVGFAGGDLGSAAINRFAGFNYPNFRTFSASLDLTF